MFVSSPFPEKVYSLNRLKYRHCLANSKNRNMFEIHTLIPLPILPEPTHGFLKFLSPAAEPTHPFPKHASLLLHINAETIDAVSNCISSNALSFLCHPRSPGFFLNKSLLVLSTLAWGTGVGKRSVAFI